MSPKEIKVEGFEVSSRRTSGITIIDGISNALPDVDWTACDWFAKAARNGLHFESVDSVLFTGDKRHAIVQGRDEEELSLIRDGEVVLSGEFAQMDVIWNTENCSELAVIADRSKNGFKEAYFIDKNGQSLLLESALRMVSVNVRGESKSKAFALGSIGSVDGYSGYAARVWGVSEDGSLKEIWNFAFPGHFMAFDEILVDRDLTHAILVTGNGVFKNNEVLVKEHGSASVATDPDFSRILTVVIPKNITNKIAHIRLNGQTLMITTGQAAEISANDGLTLAAVKLLKPDSNKHELFIVNVGASSLLGPYEDVGEVGVDNEKIVAEVETQKGVWRELTIRPSKVLDSEKSF